MSREFDHLVVAAATLDQGSAWVESHLGVAPGAGGKHPTMGTHNRLLSLGPGRFLEVMAIDPEAPAPARPRWFEFDVPTVRERLARSAALVHWVERTGDLEAEIRDYPVPVEITPFVRGAYRWRMALTRDGSFPAGGEVATLIQWEGCASSRCAARHGRPPGAFYARGGHARGGFLDPVRPAYDSIDRNNSLPRLFVQY